MAPLHCQSGARADGSPPLPGLKRSGTASAVKQPVTLFEFSVFFSVLFGAGTGAFAGARHGALGFLLGGVAGLAIGFASCVLAMSPMAVLSRGQATGLRAKLDGLVGGVSLFFLVPVAPFGAGLAAWWLVRLV